jgi:hypothetical protein
MYVYVQGFLGVRLASTYRKSEGALSTLAKLREDEEGVEWEGWEKVGMKDVHAWLLEILAHGWSKRDWFQKIVKGAGHLEEDVESRDKVLSKATKGGHEASNAQQPKLNSYLVRFPTHPNPSTQLIKNIRKGNLT